MYWCTHTRRRYNLWPHCWQRVAGQLMSRRPQQLVQTAPLLHCGRLAAVFPAGHGCTAAGQRSTWLQVQVLALTAGRFRCSCSSCHALKVCRQLWGGWTAPEPCRCGSRPVSHQQAGNHRQQAPPTHHAVVWRIQPSDRDAQAGLHAASSASSCEYQQKAVGCCSAGTLRLINAAAGVAVLAALTWGEMCVFISRPAATPLRSSHYGP